MSMTVGQSYPPWMKLGYMVVELKSLPIIAWPMRVSGSRTSTSSWFLRCLRGFPDR